MDWHEFFLDHDEADDVADELRLTGIRERFLSPEEPVLLSPIVLSETAIDPLCQDLARLTRLIQTLPDRYDNNLERLALELGLPSEEAALLRERPVTDTPVLGRWDLFQTARGWEVMEFNVGGAVSGLNCEAMQHEYQRQQDLWAPAHVERAGGNGLDALGHLLTKRLDPDHSTVLILDDDDQLADSPLTATTASAQVARVTGKTAQVRAVGSLQPGDFDGAAVFEVFTLNDIARHPERYRAYLDALKTQRCRSLMPLESDLFMNKATLALLHENLENDVYSEDDARLIRDRVPMTHRLSRITDTSSIRSQRHQWVLKTTVGYGGFGVTCGWALSERDWNTALDNALERPGEYIVQHRIKPVNTPILAMSPAGDFIERHSPVVLGVFLNGSAFAGGLARAPINNAAVINAHHQAAVGVIRVKE